MRYELATSQHALEMKRLNTFRFEPCWRTHHDDCPGHLDLPSRQGWERCFCSCICHMNDRGKYDANGQPYAEHELPAASANGNESFGSAEETYRPSNDKSRES